MEEFLFNFFFLVKFSPANQIVITFGNFFLIALRIKGLSSTKIFEPLFLGNFLNKLKNQSFSLILNLERLFFIPELKCLIHSPAAVSSFAFLILSINSSFNFSASSFKIPGILPSANLLPL